MRAMRVHGLEGAMPLATAARRIVAVRVDEVYGLAADAVSGADPAALHDMRIAAKRLRYFSSWSASRSAPSRVRRRDGCVIFKR